METPVQHRDGPLSRNGALVRAIALFPLVRYFKGVDGFQKILTRNGLAAGSKYDPYELIPLRDFLSVLEEAARFAREPVLGAKLGLTVSPGELGPAGLLMMQSATLRRGLASYAKSISALQSATEMRLVECDGQLDFTYQINIDDSVNWPQDAEMSLSSTCNLIRTCFDPKWRPSEIHFLHGYSERPDQLAKIFRAPVYFGQSANRIIFSAEKADICFRTEDKELIAVVSRHLGDLMIEENENRNYADRVKSIVARKMGRSSCDPDSVAHALGMTARTLQRRLLVEGTSLREILKEHRKEIVKTHLQRSGRNLSEVAWSLGYSDGTVLWRAYKHWTGVAPSRERKAMSRNSLGSGT